MSTRRAYHPGLPGLIYLLVTGFLGVGSVNSQNNLLYAAFGLSLGGLLVSGLISGSGLMSLRVSREPLISAVEGEIIALRYVLENRGKLLPIFAVRVKETGPSGWPHRRLFHQRHAFLAHLAPGATTVVETAVRPSKRGVIDLTTIRVESSFPFGVIRKSIEHRDTARLLVRPAPQAVAGLTTRSNQGGESDRFDPARLGRADEYIGVREYRPGDSRRRIAWRATARTDRLIVREHAMQAPRLLWIGLELSGPRREAFGEDTREPIFRAAAHLIESSAGSGVAVGVFAPAAGMLIRPPSGGLTTRASIAKLLDALAQIDLEQLDASGQSTPVPRGRLIVLHDGSPGGDWPAHAELIAVEPGPPVAAVNGDIGPTLPSALMSQAEAPA